MELPGTQAQRILELAYRTSTMTTPGVSATTSRRRSRAARNIAVALAAAVTACLLVAYLAAALWIQ